MRMCAGALLWAVLAVHPVPGQVRSCAGDCDGDGFVRIYELVRLVKSALNVPCLIPEPELCPLDPCFGRMSTVTG